MNEELLQKWLLRLTAATEMLAFISVVMPQSWMKAGHLWLGMGEMRSSPLLLFMIRQASYTYGLHGISLWILSTDLKRFRPLIIFNGVAFALAGIVFFVIDYSSGMPWFWTIGDSIGCGAFGVLLLWLNRKPPESK